jgi:hypothetical protein
MTKERMTGIMRDSTTRDVVLHCLIEKTKEDTIDCPRHLGDLVIAAWQHILQAGENPFPPAAMLPLYVVIPFLAPGAVLLFPRVGERGFWVELIAMDGPLQPEEFAKVIQTSPILVIITATRQEGVSHIATISPTYKAYL